MFDDATRPANHARFAFLNPRARDFWRDWERIATVTVAMLRTEAGRDPYDRALTDLVGELCTRSGSSGPAGRLTTYGCTAPASNSSAIPSSARST